MVGVEESNTSIFALRPYDPSTGHSSSFACRWLYVASRFLNFAFYNKFHQSRPAWQLSLISVSVKGVKRKWKAAQEVFQLCYTNVCHTNKIQKWKTYSVSKNINDEDTENNHHHCQTMDLWHLRQTWLEASSLMDLLGSGTVKQCCSGCRPPECLCSGRRCPPVSLWRCFGGAVPCHAAAARSSRRPPRTGHSQRRCSQTGMRGRHWQTAPWWPTGIHSAGSCWTFLLPCKYKRSALATCREITQHILNNVLFPERKKVLWHWLWGQRSHFLDHTSLCSMCNKSLHQ